MSLLDAKILLLFMIVNWMKMQKGSIMSFVSAQPILGKFSTIIWKYIMDSMRNSLILNIRKEAKVLNESDKRGKVYFEINRKHFKRAVRFVPGY